MPIPPNTSPATATVLTVDVPVTTVQADIALAPNGTGFTSTCAPSNPQKQALWFTYTLPAGVRFISFGIQGVPAFPVPHYVPTVNIWTAVSPGVYTRHTVPSNPYCHDLSANGGWFNSFEVLGDPGTVYWFQVQNTGTTPIDYDLTVLVTHAPTGSGVAGDLLIPDDLGPFPAAVIRVPSGAVVGYVAYGNDWAGETFSVIQQGGWVLSEHRVTGPLLGRAVECFGPPPTFPHLSTIDLTPWTSSNNSVRDAHSDQRRKHYVTTNKSAADYLHQIDAATGVLEATVQLPSRASVFIGVHTASGVVYYTDYNNFSTVHRMDLTTGAALPDFLPDSGQYRAEGFVLPDGTVGIVTQDVTDVWDTYRPDGTPIQSVTHAYHRFSLDNALTGIWFWEASSRAEFRHALIASLDVNDQSVTSPGPVISTSGGPTGPDYDGLRWGYSDSCPVLVYPLVGVPPAPPEGRVIRRLRRAPHVAQDHKRTFVKRFALDLERGQAPETGQGSEPVVLLRVSNDGGQTWGEETRMPAGRLGDYTARTVARRLGHGRDLVFEVVVSDPLAWSLVGAWLELEGGRT